MKKTMILSAALVILNVFGIQAQEDMANGYVKMELTDVSSSNEQMAAGLEMMKGMTVEISFTPEKSFTIMNMMSGMMTTKTLVDIKTKDVVLLFDMMGQKIKVESNQSDLKTEEMEEMMKDTKVTEFKDDTKEIAGYKCYKVEIEMKNMKMDTYITEDIKASASNLQGFENLKLNGFPLEYKISMGTEMSMTYSAVKVESKVDESVFNLDTEGYKVMTMEEFQNSMGGMSGGGMGF